jgi:tRNA nucleotidyltransferase/poly(A) polymerase
MAGRESNKKEAAMTVKVYEVGGCVRDALLGLPCNDVDFVGVAPSFNHLRHYVEHVLGLEVIEGTVKPEYATFKARVPKGHKLRERCTSADFVLARVDGPSSDGRRPDYVEPGTLEDDLKRRDFTVNAMARDLETGELVDLYEGQQDLKNKVLRFVGDPKTRIQEDGLRVLRALRFSVTKGFSLVETMSLDSDYALEALRSVSRERMREELEKMFKHDTLFSLTLLQAFPRLLPVLFKDGLRLSATMKGK